jgi:hypothetical protein
MTEIFEVGIWNGECGRQMTEIFEVGRRKLEGGMDKQGAKRIGHSV